MPLMAFTCPEPTHYPIACTVCMSISKGESTQSVANQTCQSKGGTLVTVGEKSAWEIIILYLESLNLNTTGVWVGYR